MAPSRSKAATPVSPIVASLPPVSMASAMPLRTISQAMPRLSLAVAQAEATAKLGPRAPMSMPTRPPAPLGIIMGMVKALTRRGPEAVSTRTAS